jgi:hypothetical protein
MVVKETDSLHLNEIESIYLVYLGGQICSKNLPLKK